MTSTKPVVCPFCGKGPIQLDARVCDRCGKDLSTFWRTLNFLENQSLLRKPVQQMPLEEQKTTDKALTEQTNLETSLPASVPQSKPDATETSPLTDSTRLTGKVREKPKLTETVPRAEPETKESETENLRRERDNPRERVRTEVDRAPREAVAIPSQLDLARRRLTRPRLVALAVALVAIVALGLVASVSLGLIPFTLQMGTSQGNTTTSQGSTRTSQGSTCTITGAGGCQIGSLYIGKLNVTTGSYNGTQTLDIRFSVNDTGTAPLTITAVTFDNAPVQNGPPLPTNPNFPAFWWSSSNAVGASTQITGNARFMLEVPWAQIQYGTTPLNGVHTIALVDSSGTSYAFSFKGTLNVP